MNNTLKKVFFISACAAAFVIVGVLLYTIQNGTLTIGENQTTTPEEHMFYLAEKENKPLLFYRYPDLLIEHKKPARTIGHVAFYEQPYNLTKHPNEFVDFKDLQNPKKLFAFEGHPGIENYLVSADKKHLLLSFVGGKNDTTNYIYQIDLQTLKSKKVWENELRSGPLPYNGGIAYVTHFVPDRYIAFAIVKHTPPPDELPVGVIIKNLQSGKEKILGSVGEITIHEKEGTVSFKELEKTPVPCEQNDPVCFATDTYKYEYKPGGDPVTQPLP